MFHRGMSAQVSAGSGARCQDGRRRKLSVDETRGSLRLARVAAGPLSDNAATEMASRLRVLSHPVRIKLLSMLITASQGEECGRVLAAAIGRPETTISHHLQLLRTAGFIQSRRRGMHVYHRADSRALHALSLSATLDAGERGSGLRAADFDGDTAIVGPGSIRKDVPA
jgi:ArsR family transcriptional regulator, arsenate/arsenite/antimonite-responsive transcriptional repressor